MEGAHLAEARSSLALMQLQVVALFRHDARGRLVATNAAGDPPAPRFFLGRTAGGSVFRVRHDLPDSVVAALAAIVRAEPADLDLGDLPRGYDRLCAVLREHAPIRQTYVGPAFWFPTEPPVPPGVVAVDVANQHLLERSFADLIPDLATIQPVRAIVVGGAAVSVAHSSRWSPRAAEVGVETVPEYRGRGYATAVVAAWAAAVRQRGRIPLYSTTRDNLASRGVARRLGLAMYGVDLGIT